MVEQLALERKFMQVFKRFGQRRMFRRGEIVLEETDTNAVLYFIASGTVEGTWTKITINAMLEPHLLSFMRLRCRDDAGFVREQDAKNSGRQHRLG